MGKKKKEEKEDCFEANSREEEVFEDFVLITVRKDMSRYGGQMYPDVTYVICDTNGIFIDATTRKNKAIRIINSLLVDRLIELKEISRVVELKKK